MSSFDHALEIYEAIKNKKLVTDDTAQLYLAIVVLGDEVMKLREMYQNKPLPRTTHLHNI